MSWSNVWHSFLGKLSTRQNLKKSLKEWDCEHKFKKGKDDPCSEMAFLQISTCTVCWGRQQPENKTLCRKEIMHFCSQLLHHFVQVLLKMWNVGGRSWLDQLSDRREVWLARTQEREMAGEENSTKEVVAKHEILNFTVWSLGCDGMETGWHDPKGSKFWCWTIKRQRSL